MLVHRHVQLVRAKVRRRMQHAIRHHEAVINVHHRVRRQVAHAVVVALSPTLHAGEEIVLRHERVEAHGRGVIVRRTDSGIVEGIDVVNFPLRPVKVMGNGVQVVELLGHDRPGGLAEQGFRKSGDFLSHDGFRIGLDQILKRDDLPARREDVCFSFAKRCLPRAGIDDARHDGHGAAHPDFIETGASHVVRIVGSLIQAKAFSWGAKCPAGIAVQKLQHAAVLIEAVIENRSRSSIDDIVLGILVQFIREN